MSMGIVIGVWDIHCYIVIGVWDIHCYIELVELRLYVLQLNN